MKTKTLPAPLSRFFELQKSVRESSIADKDERDSKSKERAKEKEKERERGREREKERERRAEGGIADESPLVPYVRTPSPRFLSDPAFTLIDRDFSVSTTSCFLFYRHCD